MCVLCVLCASLKPPIAHKCVVKKQSQQGEGGEYLSIVNLKISSIQVRHHWVSIYCQQQVCTLMSGDLPLVPPYASQPLHNITPPDDLMHRMATLCCCIGPWHSPNTLCLIMSHLLAYLPQLPPYTPLQTQLGMSQSLPLSHWIFKVPLSSIVLHDQLYIATYKCTDHVFQYKQLRCRQWFYTSVNNNISGVIHWHD